MHYKVAVNPARHELTVEININKEIASGSSLLLETPSWVPGNYNFMQFARDIFSISAVDNASGKKLDVTREGWQGFRIHEPVGDITVRYQAYAFEPEFGEPSGILDSNYAVLLGTRYLYSRKDSGPHQVTYTLPKDWEGQIHHPSGAKKIVGTANTWEYPSYEILLDTPVVMGEFDILEKNVFGTAIYFVFVDQGVGFGARVSEFVEDLAHICEFYHEMFGSFPFADYTFVLSLNPQNDWGLEHLTSTMCGLGPDVFTSDDKYKIGVRVCAHEIFHAWNVRRLRPAPLLQLHRQLDTGSFTEGLWVAEGFTRYYEFLSCTVTGIYTPEEFFSNIIGYYEHLTVVPAYERVSAVDSSAATYLNHNPKYPGRVNNCIDYYDKGMLIAFGIDASLRLHTNEGGLNWAFREFYDQFVHWPPGNSDYPGYTTSDVLNFFENIQPGLGNQLDREANHPGNLTTETILEQLGFSVERKHIYYLGLVFTDNTLTTLYNLLEDSPAGQSGLAPQDIITHVNGYNLTTAGLKWAATHGEPVTLEVLRGHRRLSFTVTPGKREAITSLTWHGSNEQKQRIQNWLGENFDPGSNEKFSLSFYENFHGIETVL